MEKKIEITYRWWREEADIKPEHIEALEESAENKIFEMMRQGYISGELLDNVRMHEEDGEEGVEYSGWWELSRS